MNLSVSFVDIDITMHVCVRRLPTVKVFFNDFNPLFVTDAYHESEYEHEILLTLITPMISPCRYSSGSITHGDTTIMTVPFAVAQSCEGSSRQYPGEALVDLTGTGLAVNSTWVSQGETPYCDVAKHVENQIAEIDGGGEPKT